MNILCIGDQKIKKEISHDISLTVVRGREESLLQYPS